MVNTFYRQDREHHFFNQEHITRSILECTCTQHTHTSTLIPYLNEVSILCVTNGDKNRKELFEVRVKFGLKVSGQLHQ